MDSYSESNGMPQQPGQPASPGRAAAFTDGAHGGDVVGTGTYQASSLQQHVNPQFHAAGVVGLLANSYHPLNGEAESTYNQAQPNDSYYAAMARQQAAGGNGVMNT